MGDGLDLQKEPDESATPRFRIEGALEGLEELSRWGPHEVNEHLIQVHLLIGPKIYPSWEGSYVQEKLRLTGDPRWTLQPYADVISSALAIDPINPVPPIYEPYVEEVRRIVYQDMTRTFVRSMFSILRLLVDRGLAQVSVPGLLDRVKPVQEWDADLYQVASYAIQKNHEKGLTIIKNMGFSPEELQKRADMERLN